MSRWKGQMPVVLFVIALIAVYGGVGGLIRWLSGSWWAAGVFWILMGVLLFLLIALFRVSGEEHASRPRRPHRPWQV